jgi:hypothetical protein
MGERTTNVIASPFALPVREGLRRDTVERLLEQPAGVEDRHDDRHAWGVVGHGRRLRPGAHGMFDA